ncbi:MAG: bifunctional 3-hydroxydecanoyl-ACP dehydratase/trans-2-decenoyl-ACP isomerase [Paracoccaceae bacterium]|nr:bifunctional 3-hydroxydecanoyl-ACP dehydratase/trans-2-decenoyl-ACP isomerase [Paracoccaceae bacterium]MDE2915147.1 bifunctional 3-hydroxydecanoyl-ACP dehydratase/trans-2-decenoyl-ACP isomerase [Paracoccaceae bacterium]
MSRYPSAIDYEGLLRCSRGELFGPGNAQLPAPPMLMVDRVIDISADRGEFGAGNVVAEQDISPDLWFFQCHFPGDPVMPGCLGLDALWQLTGFNLGWREMPGKGRALGVGEVRFTGMITPKTQLVTYFVDFKRVIDRRLKLGIANGRVVADGDEIFVATDMKVGLFKAE